MSGRMESLAGMRGLAALMVVGFHCILYLWGLEASPQQYSPEPWLSLPSRLGLGWGFLGVDFFFVLSAFLLSRPLLAPPRDGSRSWLSYTAKRFLRIAPPYYAALLFVWLLIGRTGHPWFAMDWTQLWRHVTYTHTFWLDSYLQVSAVFWTLGIELQFYLLLPLLVIPFRSRHWPWALAGTLAVTLAYNLWVFTHTGPGGVESAFERRFLAAQLPVFLFHFGLGIAAARLHRDGWRPKLNLDLGIVAAVAACIVVPCAILGIESTFIGNETMVPYTLLRPVVAVGFAATILLGNSGAGLLANFFASAPLRRLGDWSYSLYLTHYAVGAALFLAFPRLAGLGVLGFSLAIMAVCVAVAALFYMTVERPSLRLKDWAAARLQRRTPEAIAADG